MAHCIVCTATNKAVIALANKNARMVWAMRARGESYKEPVVVPGVNEIVSGSGCYSSAEKTVLC